VRYPPEGAASTSTQLDSSNEERWRLLFERSSDAIFVGLPDGPLTAVNPAACRLLGYTEEELLAMSARDLVAPEWLDIVDQHAARNLEGLESEALYEMAFVDKGGNRIPVEMRSTVLSVGGQIIGMHAVVRDIRERRRAQAALHESEQRFQSAFEAPLVGMALASVDGRWLKVNTALCQMLGYDECELLELPILDLLHPHLRDEIATLRRRMLSGGIPTFQARARFRHRSGHYVPTLLSCSLVRDIGSQPAYTVAQMVSLDAPSRDPHGHDPDACPLTMREQQVLAHLAQGATTAETAAALSIGPETVHTYARRATSKLGARTRTHAVVKAATAGWLGGVSLPA
jgi:PAS domain S-box-containing protein